VDTERLLSVMTSAGFSYSDDLSAVGLMIVNTCAFIEPAVAESIDTILDFKAENPRAALVVAGCLPLRYRQSLIEVLPEADLFVTPDQIDHLPRLILEKQGMVETAEDREREVPPAEPPRERSTILPTPRTLTTPGYAYLKIAEGCSHACRYCTIPSIRGPLASVDPNDLENEVRFLASAGVRELVLVAQDLTSYGSDRREKAALVRLLDRIQRVDGIRWIRLMYLYPDGVKSDLIGMIRDSDKILPYLDIPFQHVSDVVLKAMGRPWKGDRIRKLVETLRAAIPAVVLRTTFMVGYPAEGEPEFHELKDFVTAYRIDRVGVFSYSAEECTRAYALGDPVPAEVKEARAEQLRSIHASFIAARNIERIGSVEQALVEGVSPETELLLQGRTWDQAPEVDGVLYITAGKAVAGEIHSVRITDAHGPDLFGETV
jgi:ribosomal protein S12 methylthiotransferase